jgi:serine/threonine protein kinase
VSTAISVPSGPAPWPGDAYSRDVSFADETPTLPVLGAPPQTCSAVSASPGNLASGTVLYSRYVLEEVIGRGGISLVFRAHDLQQALPADGAPIPIAIKVLRPELRGNRWALACLQREFRQMQRLSHPNIARVFDLGCDGDVWFIAMQLIVGPTAKTWSKSPCDPAMALRIIQDCCAALEHAHSLGILHGDLKPANVIIAEHGAAILIDFGSLPEPGRSVPAGALRDLTGTPAYASPQILMGREGEGRDDVFSLACLSYALLTGGRHPFGGHPSFVDGRTKSAPTHHHNIPAEMFKVIERGLSGERERRQASVREFRVELAAADRHGAGNGAGNPVTALVPWTDTPKVGRGLSWRATFGASLMALGIAVAVIALYFRHGTHFAPEHATAMVMSLSGPESGIAPSAGAQLLSVAAARPLAERNGVVSFAATTIQAAAAQSVIAIALRRSGRTASRGAFRWRVTTHSADTGFAYVGARTGLARFNERQTVRTLFIPMIQAPISPSRGPRMFSVILEPVAGGAALGSPASITVAIDPPASAGALAVSYLPASR